ncbi:TRAP transporter substrate-binding protein DctP [Neobacillus citreus]|uniref:TRAP transporter substrate-binding protein DctP n=2 Tax=Neobacillus TaxID=2675232 RepID=A0A942T8R2_9BACI|nr:TRAP transporter substrate-binding protein DctP [Neobacillus citreus]MCH6266970.1 TRAP transporter substrate-binding protein DctP [Neobacillus citreus]
MFKKLLPVFLVFMLIITGCGGTKSGSNGEGASGKKITLKVAGQYPLEHPNTKNLMKFKDEVEKASKGRIEVKVYPANQLGDYTLVYEEVMRGTIDMALISVPSEFEPKLEVNYVHYLAENYEKAKELFKPGSFIYNTNVKLHEKLGVKFLSFHVEGFGGIGTTKEIKNPTEPGADKGLLIRVPPIDVFRGNAQDLGFRTVAVPFAELYQALQTGVAEGWVGGPPSANYTEVRDVIKYYYQYNNFFENTSLVMNLDLWKKMSPDDQKIIQDAASALGQRSVDAAEKDDKEYMEKLKQAGVKVITFSDEDLKKFAEFTRKTTWPKLKDRLGEDIVNGLSADQ